MAVGTSVAAIATIFILSSLWLYYLSLQIPSLSDSNKDSPDFELHFPKDLDDLTEIAEVLQKFKAKHIGYVALVFCSAYMYKQTFAIPGSVFMNLLGGALFDIWIAFPLCCVLSACGASCCFVLSKYFGKTLVMKFFADKLEPLQAMVRENNDRLFFFLLSIRIFPMSPNWFINMAAPILDVPLLQFFISVLIGLMPYNFVCIQTGSILSEVRSISDVITTATMLKLGAVAIVAVLPGFLMRTFKKSPLQKNL